MFMRRRYFRIGNNFQMNIALLDDFSERSVVSNIYEFSVHTLSMDLISDICQQGMLMVSAGNHFIAASLEECIILI